MRINKLLLFVMILFIGLTVVSAADVMSDDDASMDIQQVTDNTNIDKQVSVETTDNTVKNYKNVKNDENPNPVSITSDVTIDNNNIDTYNNKNWTVAQGVTVTGTTGVSLSDVAIEVAGDYVTFDGLTISTTDCANYIINAEDVTNLTIKNSVLTLTNNNDDDTIAVKLKDTINTKIYNTVFDVNAPSKGMSWGSYPDPENPEEDIYYSIPSVAVILADSSVNVNVTDNIIDIDKSGAYADYSTMPAIVFRNQTNSSYINENVITASGAKYVYGVMVTDGANYLTIKNNTVTSTGEIYVAGIDASTCNDSIVSKNIVTATSTYVNVPMTVGYDESLAYGIISNVNNRTINTRNKICNNSISVTANVTYGIEMYRGYQNMICSNRITSNAHMAMGVAVGFTNSTYIVNNYIRTTKTADGFSPFISDIKPTNAGIHLTNQSNDNYIIGNDVYVVAIGDTAARSVNITNDTGNLVVNNSLSYHVQVDEYNYGSMTGYFDSGNTIGQNFNLEPYQCSCGCMATNVNSHSSLDSSSKTVKGDDEEDILVINNDNYSSYGRVQDPPGMYQLNKYNSVAGKTIVFAPDFKYKMIYAFAYSGFKAIKELPINTTQLSVIGMDDNDNPMIFEFDGLYAPDAMLFFQAGATAHVYNSYFATANLAAKNAILINNTIIGNGVYQRYSQYGDDIITNNYIVNITSNKGGNDAVNVNGTVENNIPTTQIDYVLNKTNYNTLFNSDNTLKDTISGTILIANNITNPITINTPVNIIAAPSPGKYTYYDGTTVDCEYLINDITFAQGSTGSNITNAIINNININDNQITISNNAINGKVTVNTATDTTVKDNNIIGDSAFIELINAEKTTIENNYLETNNTYTIIVDADSLENTIRNNTLIAGELKGDKSIENNAEDTVISDNGPLPDPELIIDTTEFTTGETATITATIYRGENIMNVNKGKVLFKVNGKTLKNAEGKVIYAKVVNGVASIEDFEVPTSWIKEGTTLTATYSGSTDCDKLTSDPTEITVTPTIPEITTSDITAAKASTITLTANIVDGDKAINTGKVVFKINGKTVKDSNGKVIYAKVTNGVATIPDYALPDSLKVGTYTITAIFTAPNYDKLESNSTLTISEQN